MGAQRPASPLPDLGKLDISDSSVACMHAAAADSPHPTPPTPADGAEHAKDAEASRAERERLASLEAAKQLGREKLRREAEERAKKNAQRREQMQQQRQQQQQQQQQQQGLGSQSSRPQTSGSVATQLIMRNISLTREERDEARRLAREQREELAVLKHQVASEQPGAPSPHVQNP